AAVAALFALVFRGSALGPLLRHGWAQHAATRAADPRRALTGLGLALAALPCFGAALFASYLVGITVIARRHHAPLESALIVGSALGFLLAAPIGTFVLGRAVELGLAALPKRTLKLASHPLTPPILTFLVVLVVAIGVAVAARKTLALLDLRPFFVLL